MASAQLEAGTKEREWREERERRAAEVQGLNQHVTQLQSSLTSTLQEKKKVNLSLLVPPGVSEYVSKQVVHSLL